jgi:hypothetical protein
VNGVAIHGTLTFGLKRIEPVLDFGEVPLGILEGAKRLTSLLQQYLTVPDTVLAQRDSMPCGGTHLGAPERHIVAIKRGDEGKDAIVARRQAVSFMPNHLAVAG